MEDKVKAFLSKHYQAIQDLAHCGYNSPGDARVLSNWVSSVAWPVYQDWQELGNLLRIESVDLLGNKMDLK